MDVLGFAHRVMLDVNVAHFLGHSSNVNCLKFGRKSVRSNMRSARDLSCLLRPYANALC